MGGGGRGLWDFSGSKYMGSMTRVVIEFIFAGPLCAVENNISTKMFILLSLWFLGNLLFVFRFHVSQGLRQVRCVQA